MADNLVEMKVAAMVILKVGLKGELKDQMMAEKLAEMLVGDLDAKKAYYSAVLKVELKVGA
jgi:hypothetical protein